MSDDRRAGYNRFGYFPPCEKCGKPSEGVLSGFKRLDKYLCHPHAMAILKDECDRPGLSEGDSAASSKRTEM